MGLMTRIFWRGMLGVLPGLCPGLKVPALPLLCVDAARFFCNCWCKAVRVVARRRCGTPSVSCLCCLPPPVAPWPEGWPECHCSPSLFSPGPGDTAQSQPSMVTVGVCVVLSPRFMLEGGSVTCGLISVVQRDLQPPPHLAHCSVHHNSLHPTNTPFSPSPGVLSSCSPHMVCGVR